MVYRKHAMLSASSSNRWLNCPPSAVIKEARPKYNTSEEGTYAHKLSELYLRFWLGYISQEEYNQEYSSMTYSMYYSKDMEDYLSKYISYVQESVNAAYRRSNNTVVSIEQKLDLSSWVADGTGIADVIIASDGVLEIIDLKYGWMVVNAENNSQLRLYALGAIEVLKGTFDIHTVAMTVVQPRQSHKSTEVLSIDELLSWANDKLKVTADKAYLGVGDFESGEHCNFCEIKSTCKERTENNLKLMGYEFKEPFELNNDEILDVLNKAKQLKKWVDDVEEYAQDLMVNRNHKFEGYKKVYSSMRSVYKDEQAVVDRLAGKYNLDEVAPRKPLSISRMRGLLGEEVMNDELEGLLETRTGKVIMVQDNDRRRSL